MTSKRKFTGLMMILLICIILGTPIPFRRFLNPTVYPPPEGAATRILLLGDSIAGQYFDALAKRLPAGTLLVTLRVPRTQTLLERLRSPVDEMLNTRDSRHLLEAIRAWMPVERFDTILINAGLHDLKRHPDGREDRLGRRATDFRQNLHEIGILLRPHAARLCFVATTRIAFAPRDDVDVLNRIAKEVMASLDAHFIELPWPPDADSMFLEDGYHLNSRGIDHVAQAIANDLDQQLSSGRPSAQ